MDDKQFWELIEQAGRRARAVRSNGYQERFVAALKDLLRTRGPEDVVQFGHRFQAYMHKAYHYDLWDVAYLIGQGYSDDGFSDFRAWLISMGRDVYEQALANPDSLAEPTSPGTGDCFFEGLLAVPVDIFEEMTGTDFPPYPGRVYSDPPPGIKRSEDALDLERRFPALWAKHGSFFDSSDR